MTARRIQGCSMSWRICTNCAVVHIQRAARTGRASSRNCRTQARRVHVSTAMRPQPAAREGHPARQKCAPARTRARKLGKGTRREAPPMSDFLEKACCAELPACRHGAGRAATVAVPRFVPQFVPQFMPLSAPVERPRGAWPLRAYAAPEGNLRLPVNSSMSMRTIVVRFMVAAGAGCGHRAA